MICIKTEIPKEICEIDDELKAIYHSRDTVCIWVFKSREDRNNFMNETVGMKKEKNIIQIIMGKKSNHCLNLISDCRVEQNREL